jgi:hypothetical protein
MSSSNKTESQDSSQTVTEKEKTPRVVSVTMDDATEPEMEKEKTPRVVSVTMGDVLDDTNSGSADKLEKKGDEEDKDAIQQFADPRTQLYSYVVPLKTNPPSDHWERDKNEAVAKAMDRDLKEYGFGDTPEDPEAAENWRLRHEAALLRKIKHTIYAYTQEIKDLPENYTDEALDDCIEAIEEEEDSYEFRRPPDMLSHTDWSKARLKQKERFDEEDAVGEGKRKQIPINKPPAGWDGLDKEINNLPENIPDEVRRIHRTMCILMFQWWEAGFPQEDSVKIVSLNARLDTIKGSEDYKVAPTEIALWMPKLRKALEMCEEDSSEANSKELMKTAITLTNKLRKSGLDWKMVISRDTHRRFFGCINNITETENCELRDHFEEEYLKPRKEQLQQLGDLAPIFQSLIGVSQDSDRDSKKTIRLDRLPMFVETSHAINQKVQACNSRLGLRQSDHNLPVADLEAAFASYIAGRIPEAINYVTKFTHKLNLLQIGGIDEVHNVCTSSKGVCDTLEALREVLDLSTGPQLAQLVEDIPSLSISTHTFAFEGVPVKTVGYGNFQGRFYINQYGPQNAPVWRIERYPTAQWTSEFGSDPPHGLCVTNVKNRMGDVYDDSGKKKWGSEHIGGWYGVAFEDSIDTVDPRLVDKAYYKHNNLRLPRLTRCYVLVGWDPLSEKKSFDKKWETRSTIRRFLGESEADRRIYNSAVACEKRFQKYLRGELGEQERPEQVFMNQQKAMQKSIKKENSKKDGELVELKEIPPYKESERRVSERHRRAVGQAEY